MWTAAEIHAHLIEMGVTHVTGVPDSTFGPWFDELRTSTEIRLIPVCREGEAWGVAAGLHLGGARPVIMIQCTGLFESGDALRNVLFDLGLPLYAIVGYRNFLNRSTATDSTLRFTEPILDAWGVDYVLIDAAEQIVRLREHFHESHRAGSPGIALVAEGKG